MYTATELRQFAEDFPFLPDSIFRAKNHGVLKIALKNIDDNLLEVRRSTSLRMKDGSIALRYGAPLTRQQRASAEEIEDMQLRIIAGLQSEKHSQPAISDSEQMRRRLQAVLA